MTLERSPGQHARGRQRYGRHVSIIMMSVIFEKLFIYIIIHYCMSVKILYISFIRRKYIQKPPCIKNIYIPLFSLMMTVTVGCPSCLNTIRQQHVLLIIILMCFGNTPAIRYTKNLWKSFLTLTMRLSFIGARTARPDLMSSWKVIPFGCHSNR